jgi:putative oxidoreductase
MTIVRLVARPMLSAMFISGGINALKNPSMLAKRAEPVTERLEPVVEKATSSLPIALTPEQLVMVNGVVHVTCGAMLATGKMPRLAALVLAASMVPTTLGGHRFWEEADPVTRAAQRNHFLKNVSMTGGLLLASVDTEGKPSVAWRAKRQARHARDVVAEQASSLTSH